METQVLLLTTIDNLLQRIIQVEICQTHWTLITKYLTRLQEKLKTREATKSTIELQEEIQETLIIINEVLTRCTDGIVSLHGMTYRDFESLLFRLQLKLAQHEADLTDDYQIKIDILSTVYNEQKILVRQVFDETMRTRLELDTQAHTIEQVHLLREKYFDIIKIYLDRCIELHKSVPLTGLTGDIVAQVAKIFYQISSEIQLQLEQNWQSSDLPLTRTFIQFKADKSTSFERNESRRLVMEVTEENLIRTKRWIVILGDPGSGKTSFARWLVHHLAQTLLLNGQHSTDYGPLRIPILIRIGEFAEILKENPSLTLFDYIGQHKWMGKEIVDDSTISLDHLSRALQDYIKQGQALIILDGLDEIPFSEQRSKIVTIVENFADTYIQTPTGISVFDNPYLSKLLDDPSQSGGNQLIVTSRIVGYHTAPLAGQFTHYTIQPMDMKHMKDFVDYWFFRVHQQILDTLSLPSPNQGEKHGEALKKELDNSALLDMASNSCLMSFICSVAFSQLEGSPLPTQRILLYETIVNSMLNLWSSKKSTIPTSQLISILSDIATYIHVNSASGLIHEEKMKEICLQSMDRFSMTKTHTNQVSDFVRIIREDVGILTARGESLYGFLHLTFQEYFTCLKLIDVDHLERTDGLDKIQLITQSLHRHTNDPRFRVPIALALGKISASWNQQDFDDFCVDFIQEKNESDYVLPSGAHMLISCSNDLVHYPSTHILFDILNRLMIAAGQHKWSTVCSFFLDHITFCLRKLRHDVVVQWITYFLSRFPRHDIHTISTLCHLLEGKPLEFENIKWLNQSTCLMLQQLSVLDNEINEFAIDRLLVKIAFSSPRLLSVHQNTFKAFLLDHEVEINSIPSALFSVIVSLYGGLKRDGEQVVFDPFYIYRESISVTPILIRYLPRNNTHTSEEAVMFIKQECERLLFMQIHESSPETIDLCIATICLSGIDAMKAIPISLLQISLNRLKYISMILRQLYFPNENDDLIEKNITEVISRMIQNVPSEKEKFLGLLNSLNSGLARLRSSFSSILCEGKSIPYKRLILNLPNSLRTEYKHLHDLLSPNLQFHTNQKSCSLLPRFVKLFWIPEHNIKYNTESRMANIMDTVPEYLLFHNDRDILFPLTFISPHLQPIYLRLLKKDFIMINAKDCTITNIQYLYFSHILVDCLMTLSNTTCKLLSLTSALMALLPWLRTYHLDNLRALMDETFLPGEDRKMGIKECIEQEQQRLENALITTDERNMKLYSACVSLTQVCQWTEEDNRLHLLQQSIDGAMSIDNLLIRLDALCVISFYSHSDYDQLHITNSQSLSEEIHYQLNTIYSTLPLLLHTVIFIRCLPLLRDRQIMNKCLENLFHKFINAEHEDQQVVYEALSPYLQSHMILSLMLERMDSKRIMINKSEYLYTITIENRFSSLLISNMYLMELTSDIYQYLSTDYNSIFQLYYDLYKAKETRLFEFTSPILTVGQALMISNILFSISSSEQLTSSEKICRILSNALHHFDLVEFKACRIVEDWMKWKDSHALSLFAHHAALLLSNSNLWSVEVASIICDLLCCENDRFRQRAEMILRAKSDDNDVRTTTQLGIDVLLTIALKKAHYTRHSSAANLTIARFFENTILDSRSHLNTYLWLERYRLYSLTNGEHFLNKSKLLINSRITACFPNNITVDAFFCYNKSHLSKDLVHYICDLIKSNFASFLAIDGDTTSIAVVESHVQFVVAILVSVETLFDFKSDNRELAVDAVVTLFDSSTRSEIREAAAYALGYICDPETYEILSNRLQMAMKTNDNVLKTLVSSYCHCLAIKNIDLKQEDLELFRKLLKHPDQHVVEAMQTGLGRVMKDKAVLLEMLDFDYVLYYHALMDAISYLFIYNVLERNTTAIVEFIEQHPDLLSIFIIELYNSIRHFTDEIVCVETVDYYLKYGYVRYIEVASLIAVRMPAAFCTYIRDWRDGENLKRALFYTSKQHDYPKRAACLTVLSIFGELTVELCEMIIESLRDDPHIQNTWYKCLNRIISIKNQEKVFDLLLTYLKSKSMNTRYVTTKLLLHLSKSLLISTNYAQTVLKEVILDPDSNEDLRLIAKEDALRTEYIYYNAGPLKDVIYSLLIQHLTGVIAETGRRNQLNDIGADFVESETVSRLTSCIYDEDPASDSATNKQND